jgi:hypothetical protein
MWVGKAMILLAFAVVGAAAGATRAWRGGRQSASPDLRQGWLVPLALMPQGIAFFAPATRHGIPCGVAAAALVSSQVLLLLFAWRNRQHSGFRMMGIGLTLNLIVIVLNGGLMPISPQTASLLAPGRPESAWPIGERLGGTKDIVLPGTATRLPGLSDRFVLPAPGPWRAAISLGDVTVGAGAFHLLWALGRKQPSLPKGMAGSSRGSQTMLAEQ